MFSISAGEVFISVGGGGDISIEGESPYLIGEVSMKGSEYLSGGEYVSGRWWSISVSGVASLCSL
jgi:hypothetical protein